MPEINYIDRTISSEFYREVSNHYVSKTKGRESPYVNLEITNLSETFGQRT